jgi:hypothetical protein
MFKNDDENVNVSPYADKTTLFGILLILLAVAVYVFFAKPVGAEVSLIKNQVVVKENEIETLKTELAKFEEAKEELQLVTEVQRRESLRAIPVNIDQDEVIRDLLKIAEANNIVLRSISFSKSEGATRDAKILRINAGFEAGYNDLTRFLRGLETNSRLFRVVSINVQVRKLDFIEYEGVSFSLGIETFYQQ